MNQTEANARMRILREEQVGWMKILDIFSKAVDELNRQAVLVHEQNRRSRQQYLRQLEQEFTEAHAEEVRVHRETDEKDKLVDRRLKDLEFHSAIAQKREQEERQRQLKAYKETLVQERAKEKRLAQLREVEKYQRELLERSQAEGTPMRPTKHLAPLLNSPSVDPEAVKRAIDRDYRESRYKQGLVQAKLKQKQEQDRIKALERNEKPNEKLPTCNGFKNNAQRRK